MIRIGIADGHAVVRAGLRSHFDAIDLKVVAEAANCREALRIAREDLVDVLVMDLLGPDGQGVDTLRAIRAEAPRLPVLIFSGLPEKHHAAKLLSQGANGYLSKGCDPAELVKAIRTVSRGQTYRAAVRLDEPEIAAADEIRSRLSAREFEVFTRLAGGGTLTQVALDMGLSIKTVSTYRSRVLEKLALGSNSEITYCAIHNGILQ